MSEDSVQSAQLHILIRAFADRICQCFWAQNFRHWDHWQAVKIFWHIILSWGCTCMPYEEIQIDNASWVQATILGHSHFQYRLQKYKGRYPKMRQSQSNISLCPAWKNHVLVTVLNVTWSLNYRAYSHQKCIWNWHILNTDPKNWVR